MNKQAQPAAARPAHAPPAPARETVSQSVSQADRCISRQAERAGREDYGRLAERAAAIGSKHMTYKACWRTHHNTLL